GSVSRAACRFPRKIGRDFDVCDTIPSVSAFDTIGIVSHSPFGHVDRHSTRLESYPTAISSTLIWLVMSEPPSMQNDQPLRVVLLGPKGAGKTTLLAALAHAGEQHADAAMRLGELD